MQRFLPILPILRTATIGVLSIYLLRFDAALPVGYISLGELLIQLFTGITPPNDASATTDEARTRNASMVGQLDTYANSRRRRSLLGSEDGELAFRIHAPDHEQTTVTVRSPKCSIGSHESCTLRLKAADLRPVHCWVMRGANGAWVRRWSQQTLLNGQGFEAAPLRVGDRLRFGAIELELIDIRPEPPASASGKLSAEANVVPAVETTGDLDQPADTAIETSGAVELLSIEEPARSLANRLNELETLLDDYAGQREREAEQQHAVQEELRRLRAVVADRERQLGDARRLASQYELELQSAREHWLAERAALERQIDELGERIERLAETNAEIAVDADSGAAQAAVALASDTAAELVAEPAAESATVDAGFDAELRAEHERTIVQLAELQQQLGEREREHAEQTARLTEQRDELLSRVDELQSSLDHIRPAHDAALATAERVERQLTSERESWQTTHELLAREIADLHLGLEQTQAALEATQEALDESQQALLEAHTALDESQTALIASEASHVNSRGELSELHEQLRAADQLSERLSQLEAELLAARAENAASANANSADTAELTATVAELRERLEQAESEREQLSSELEATREDSQRQRELTSREREDWNASRQEWWAEKEGWDTERTHLAEQSERNESAWEEERAELRSKIDELQADRDSLEQQLSRIHVPPVANDATFDSVPSDDLPSHDLSLSDVAEDDASLGPEDSSDVEHEQVTASRPSNARFDAIMQAAKHKRPLVPDAEEDAIGRRHSPPVESNEQQTSEDDTTDPMEHLRRIGLLRGDLDRDESAAESPTRGDQSGTQSKFTFDASSFGISEADGENVDETYNEEWRNEIEDEWEDDDNDSLVMEEPAPKQLDLHDEPRGTVASSPAKDHLSPSTLADERSDAEEEADHDESIQAYMNRLLNRVRDDRDPAPAPLPKATPAPMPLPIAEEPKYVEPKEYIPRSQAPERGVNMAAIREVANESARNAISKSTRSQWVTTATLSYVIAFFSFAVALVLFIYLDQRVLGILGGLALLVVSGAFVFRATMILRHVSQANLTDDSTDARDGSGFRKSDVRQFNDEFALDAMTDEQLLAAAAELNAESFDGTPNLADLVSRPRDSHETESAEELTANAFGAEEFEAEEFGTEEFESQERAADEISAAEPMLSLAQLEAEEAALAGHHEHGDELDTTATSNNASPFGWPTGWPREDVQ